MFGLWVIALFVLWSVAAKSVGSVLAGTGSVVFITYLLGMVPKIKEYLPTALTDGTALIYNTAKPDAYIAPLIISIASALVFVAVSICLFRKKKI